jgi:hypothetical protein
VLDVAVAECRAGDDLLRPCDESFIEFCNDVGGDFVSHSGPDFVLEIAPICSIDSLLHPRCDTAFEAACDRHNGSFICFGEECLSGQCSDIVIKQKCSATNSCGGSCSAEGRFVTCNTSADGKTATCLKLNKQGEDTDASGAHCGAEGSP